MTGVGGEQSECLIRKIVDVASLPPKGTTIRIVADRNQLDTLAGAYNLKGIKNFSAELMVKPFRKTGASVIGIVEATVVQNCVVTLELVDQAISEAVDLRLMPADRDEASLRRDVDIDIDPAGIDPPEQFCDGRIDLGPIAMEHFALGIDAYPRKPGVDFEAVESDEDKLEDGAEPSPFSVLNRLKTGNAS